MQYVDLTKGKKALVDDEDYDIVSKYKWHYSSGYAKRNNLVHGKKMIARMHHMIVPFTKGYMVDHINGNGLDNRRSNLRLVTKSQNMMNSGVRRNNKSGYKGVSWDKINNKWRVTIWRMNKQFDVGRFEDILDAARAYNEAARIYHGEYARLNKL